MHGPAQICRRQAVSLALEATPARNEQRPYPINGPTTVSFGVAGALVTVILLPSGSRIREEHRGHLGLIRPASVRTRSIACNRWPARVHAQDRLTAWSMQRMGAQVRSHPRRKASSARPEPASTCVEDIAA